MTADLDLILTLNAAHEIETSPLDLPTLRQMIANAFHVAHADAGREGFLIAFDQNADYDSVNFRWFQARYDQFVYVDRVIVAPLARGKGLARSFYADLFDHARSANHVRVVAEINLDPPNPGSVAFHAGLGFVEVGRATFPGKGKTVSYQEAQL